MFFSEHSQHDVMTAIGRQKFAPRQLLLHCPNKLHPCNDAISALPPSLAVKAEFEIT